MTTMTVAAMSAPDSPASRGLLARAVTRPYLRCGWSGNRDGVENYFIDSIGFGRAARMCMFVLSARPCKVHLVVLPTRLHCSAA